MGTSRKKREPLQMGGHYATVNGEVISIDPLQTSLPIRCKLALAELTTGHLHMVTSHKTLEVK